MYRNKKKYLLEYTKLEKHYEEIWGKDPWKGTGILFGFSQPWGRALVGFVISRNDAAKTYFIFRYLGIGAR
jgi:hypothetical protein